jgi:hypothetical protein
MGKVEGLRVGEGLGWQKKGGNESRVRGGEKEEGLHFNDMMMFTLY